MNDVAKLRVATLIAGLVLVLATSLFGTAPLASASTTAIGTGARPLAPHKAFPSLCKPPPHAANRWFVLLIWKSGKSECIRHSGTIKPQGTLQYLIDGTGVKDWVAGTAGGKKFRDCVNPLSAFLLAKRDMTPSSITLTTGNSGSGVCHNSTLAGDDLCGSASDEGDIPLFAFAVTNKGTYCWSWVKDSGETFSVKGKFSFVANVTMHEVLLEGSNWSDCFSTGSPYKVLGTRDDTPKKVEITTNKADC
jgi:hypothetical protein